jgi:hypothetical protein
MRTNKTSKNALSFQSGLQLDEGKYKFAVVGADHLVINTINNPASKYNGKDVHSVLGVATNVETNEVHDFTTVKQSESGWFTGGIAVVDDAILHTLDGKPGGVYDLTVVSREGRKYGNFAVSKSIETPAKTGKKGKKASEKEAVGG